MASTKSILPLLVTLVLFDLLREKCSTEKQEFWQNQPYGGGFFHDEIDVVWEINSCGPSGNI
jgi:hypothetical protein